MKELKSCLSGHLCVFLIAAACLRVIDAVDNSYISPNSAGDSIVNYESLGDTTSGPQHIESHTAKLELSSSKSKDDSDSLRVQRSAEPILSGQTYGADDLFAFKNIAESLDSNDVEYSGRVIIQPSRTVKDDTPIKLDQTEADAIFGGSGEAQGAPQGRSMSLLEPQSPIKATATTEPTFATRSHLQQPASPRQANPDIQDIITGIVKLLNGNVNVQANTAPAMGRPLRPLSTRINNRGPPRISDVPALPPDFDVPSQSLPMPSLGQMPPPVVPSRLPTPYPFDLPPQNTSPMKNYDSGRPHPDQIIPVGSNKRPSFYRPTLASWQRPPPRRPPQRRPIPPYKPMPLPRPAEESISITSERPNEDILNLDLGQTLPASHHELEEEIHNETHEEPYLKPSNPTPDESDEEPQTNPIETTYENQHIKEETTQLNEEDKHFEKSKEKSTSKIDKYLFTEKSEVKTEPTKINNTIKENIETISSTIDYSAINASKTENEIVVSTITEENETNTNETNTNETNTEIAIESTPVLESSIQDVIETLKDNLLNSMEISTSSTTPTEALSTGVVSSSIQTSSLSITSSRTNLNSTKTNFNNNQTMQNTLTDSTNNSFQYYSYKPRPGIVLDDTEYKPGAGNRPIITARPPQLGDIFDITVSAIQGPGGATGGPQGKPYVIPVDIENVHVGSNADVITSPVGDEGFVSIDGKRTYLNLFGDATDAQTIQPTKVGAIQASTNALTGTGFAVVEQEKKPHIPAKPNQRRPPLYNRRPNPTTVRIDTCIVGDDSTCDGSQNEICKTELGVSACHCRPGHARRKHRDPCRKVVSVLVSLRVDKLYERRVVWASELVDKTSESYQQLSYETERALESAISMTPFTDVFLNARVNSIYKGERSAGQAGVFVNLTLQLEENAETSRSNIKGEIQRHLLGVIQRRSNNIGNSALYVDSPPGSVSNLQDLDECSSPDLHDCHNLAKCTNTFGSFKCECLEGYRDPWLDNKHRQGRYCEQCSPQRCSNRGECKYKNGQEVCICSGNYYGNQCELDGEVLGVAIGASVAAIIIIGLTLVCLVMWSRRWSREQKAAAGSPVFSYMAAAGNTIKTPVMGGPPYQLTLEDRLRWAHIADVMAQSNHYAPEPVTGPTRPSSAMFGYPTLSMAGTLPQRSMHGTLPPVPMPRLTLQSQFGSRAASIHGMRPLDNSSSSEEEDKADLLGRNFQVPRPKSRSNASIANQSGIYYDVDYEQHENYKMGHQTGPGGIPLNTYAVGRPQYFRN